MRCGRKQFSRSQNPWYPRAALSFAFLPCRSRDHRQRTKHLLRGLPGMLRAEIPGVRLREESRVRKRGHVRSPILPRGRRCLEPRPAALPNVVQQLHDPIALKFRTSRAVGKSVRAVRTVDEKEIRKAGGRHSEMGTHTVSPTSPSASRPACRGYRCRSARPNHGVEAGSQDKNIEVMLAGRRLYSAARYSFDRGFLAEIDKVHVGLIEDIEKVLFEGRPLSAVGSEIGSVGASISATAGSLIRARVLSRQKS